MFTYQLFNPVVASVSPNEGGGASQSLTLTGIGFITGGTTVSFVPVAWEHPHSLECLCFELTALTVTVSGGTKNDVYYVEVTTSGGNSGTGGAANDYTY